MPLTQDLIDGLRSIPELTVQGIVNSNRLHERVPTVSVTHPRHSNRKLAQSLGGQGLNLWYGHNYAMEAARHLGLDEAEGVLRIGLAHYNTRAEVDRVVGALKTLMQ
jgi:selenocysteine lyase/cysteine desulfurase